MPAHRLTLASLAALAALACALYLPFLGNPSFFDDQYLFSGYKFSDYALSPFGLALRHPSYFSLAFVQVLWGSIEAHRLVGLAAHVACAWALYALIRELQRCAARGADQPRSDRLLAASAAGLFVLHPVAVYAAGYLVQRSIVLATGFGLLSLALFARSLRTRSYGYSLLAAAAFSLAVLCKEHVLLLPAVAAAAWCVARADRPFALRSTALYWAACAPAAVLVALIAKGVLGERYEPDFDVVAVQLSQARGAGMLETPWIGSALVQAALFFRYLGLWLLPQTARMAIDLRVDLEALWAPAVELASVAGLLGFLALAAYLLARGGRAAMAGFGLLYFWLLFLIEFSVVRFQEPFVLYRSYLWAPGLAVALAAALPRLPLRAALPACAVAALILSVQSWDRLRSMSSGIALWEDAAAKVPAEPVPGGWRPLYNLGREYLYAEQPEKALAVTDRCLAEYPGTYHCFFARAAVHMQLGQHAAAIPYALDAIALRPGEGAARHHLGVIMEELGCREQARALYELSYKLGFTGASFRLEAMDSPGKGVLAARAARLPGTCSAPPLPESAFRR